MNMKKIALISAIASLGVQASRRSSAYVIDDIDNYHGYPEPKTKRGKFKRTSRNKKR